VEQVESEHEIRRINPIGQPVPLLTGATARAILAFLAADERAAILGGSAAADRPSGAELADVRARGFSVSPGERLVGGTAMSAPIFDGAGRVCAALSISGPRFRFTMTRAQRCGPALVTAAGRLSQALGYSAHQEEEKCKG
jgi:DNA-binding IclR family transcriptional regulator